MDKHALGLKALDEVRRGCRAADLESQTLEFKEEGRSREDLLRELTAASLCFANTDGGVVVVGVSDKISGPAAVTGTTLRAPEVQRRIHELSRPSLTVEVREHSFDDRRVLTVAVPQSHELHSDTQGRATHRIGTDCLPIYPDDQRRLREERLGIDQTADATATTVDQVSPDALNIARKLLGATLDERQRLATTSDRDLLRALGVVTRSGMLTRAGVILFCQSEAPAIVYQYRSSPGGEPRAIERLPAPLLIAFSKVLSFVQIRTNVVTVTLSNGAQISIEDFPSLAVREVLANAVMHRDYHLSDPVSIEHSSDIFMVTSPGPLVSGVTPDNILTHFSKPRNPALARAIRTLGLAEEIGRGVDRMFREMIRSGRDVPTITSEADATTVRLIGGTPNTAIARFLAELPDRERQDVDTLLILYRLCSTRLVRAPDLTRLLQKPAVECEHVLRRLSRDVGVLEPTRQTARLAQPQYRLTGSALKALGSAVPYQRRTVDEIDRKVVAHVREYGTITNRTIQNLLDVGLQRAAAILGDLVEREILRKVSGHERGPGVEYGPGDKYPHRNPLRPKQLVLPGSERPRKTRKKRT